MVRRPRAFLLISNRMLLLEGNKIYGRFCLMSQVLFTIRLFKSVNFNKLGERPLGKIMKIQMERQAQRKTKNLHIFLPEKLLVYRT